MPDQRPSPSDHADVEPAPALICGPIEVRPAARELLLAGQPVAIERRAFDLLVYLMRHAGRVVDKDELWHEVWQARPVSDAALPQAVSRVRKALGDADPEAYVATVYGVGYRFDQPVRHVPQSSAPVGREAASGANAAAGSTRRSWPPTGWLVAGLLLAAAVLWWVWPARGPDAPVQTVRVALLPIHNDTGDGELDWVRFGLLPLIDSALADEGVPLVSSSTVLATLTRYPDAADPRAQARVLRLSAGADRVVSARLSRLDDSYRLDLHSVDADDAALALQFEGADIAVLAVAAGDRLAASLEQSLARWQGAGRARRSLLTDDPFINEAFARGLDARLRGRHEDAMRFFDTVLAAAPELLEAKYHLALVTRRLGDWERTDQLHRELLAAAQASGDVAMEAAVQMVSGTLTWRQGDKQAARSWYERALANYTAQGNADYVANATGNLAILAANEGDYAAAEAHFRAALAHFEGAQDRYNEATAWKNLGHLYSDQGRHDEAGAALERALAIRQALQLPLQVAQVLSALADIEMARGRWESALAHQQRVLVAAQEYRDPLLESQARIDLAAALRRLGRLQEAREMAALAHALALERDHRSGLAAALLAQGQTEHALGNGTLAAELLARAAATYDALAEPLGQARSLLALAQTMLATDRLEQATEAIAQAAELVQGAELVPLQPALAAVQAAEAQHRNDTDTALTRMDKAYRLAEAGQDLGLRMDLGGQFGRMLLTLAPADGRIDELVDALGPDAALSPDALAFLIQYHQSLDPARALNLSEQRKRLLGEGWSSEDEQALRQLRQALADPGWR